MFDVLNTYDWREAFGYAGDASAYAGYDRPIPADPAGNRETHDLTPFSRDDVRIILWIEEGENDEESWIIAGVLHDERGFTLQAGCDYTGWDCQAGGTARICNSLEEMIFFGMDESMRRRFGIQIEED